MNLNYVEPYYDKGNSVADHWCNNTRNTQTSYVDVYFRDLEESLTNLIESYPVVVGCVAWLTNTNILKSLASREYVSVIIQKEDFLRPDTGSWNGKRLRNLYSSLPSGPCGPVNGIYWGDLLYNVNYHADWQAEPVRWMGEYNTEKKSAHPRMHNKFLIFCDMEEVLNDHDYESPRVVSKCVWTGSFNMTDNATKSLENAVVIREPNVTQAYYDEWQYIFTCSEEIPEMAWDRKWTRDEYFRIGS